MNPGYVFSPQQEDVNICMFLFKCIKCTYDFSLKVNFYHRRTFLLKFNLIVNIFVRQFYASPPPPFLSLSLFLSHLTFCLWNCTDDTQISTLQGWGDFFYQAHLTKLGGGGREMITETNVYYYIFRAFLKLRSGTGEMAGSPTLVLYVLVSSPPCHHFVSPVFCPCPSHKASDVQSSINLESISYPFYEQLVT